VSLPILALLDAPLVLPGMMTRRDETLEVGPEDELPYAGSELVLVAAAPLQPAPWARASTLLRPAVALALVAACAFVVGAVQGRRAGQAIARAATAQQAPRPALAAALPTPQPFELARALGHRAFAAGHREEALRHYDRALRLDDRQAPDAQMTANLIACYGSRQAQPAAATLIVRHQLRDAEPALQQLRRRGATRGTRSGALYTLEKLGRGARRAS